MSATQKPDDDVLGLKVLFTQAAPRAGRADWGPWGLGVFAAGPALGGLGAGGLLLGLSQGSAPGGHVSFLESEGGQAPVGVFVRPVGGVARGGAVGERVGLPVWE